MDLKEIQQILGDGGGKLVIVENGNPVMIILPYKDFKEIEVQLNFYANTLKKEIGKKLQQDK